jgi:hypothetical protein
MSTENDVPLGEGAQRYYEQQFGDRIRKVSKGDNRPRGGGSVGWGKGGCGTLFMIAIVIRIIAAFFRSSGSNTNTYRYTPPPPPPPVVFQQPQLGQELFQPQPDPLAQFKENLSPLLTANDVPLLQGLCYRIYQESRQPKPTPGGHLLKLLDPAMRDLLGKAAKGMDLDGIERSLLLIALNETLMHEDFWDKNAFLQVPGMKEFLKTRNGIDLVGGDPPLHHLEARRRVLELCYPRQIVPLTERNRPDNNARDQWRRQARADLEAARKQYEPTKP